MNVGERLQCLPDTIMGLSYETQLSESSHVETLLRNQCNHVLNAGSSSAALLSALYIDPFTVYVTGKFEVRSAHVGVRKFIPSH